jgi:hypothetical protein
MSSPIVPPIDFAEMYSQIRKENDVLTTSIEDEQSVEQQKTKYQMDEISFMLSVNKIIFIIYYLLAIVLLTIFVIKKIYSWATFIFIALCILSFPWIITPIELKLFECGCLFIQWMKGNVYLDL